MHKIQPYGYGPSEVILIIKLCVVCVLGKAYYDFRSFDKKWSLQKKKGQYNVRKCASSVGDLEGLPAILKQGAFSFSHMKPGWPKIIWSQPFFLQNIWVPLFYTIALNLIEKRVKIPPKATPFLPELAFLMAAERRQM